MAGFLSFDELVERLHDADRTEARCVPTERPPPAGGAEAPVERRRLWEPVEVIVRHAWPDWWG